MIDYFPDTPDTELTTANEAALPGSNLKPSAFTHEVAAEVTRLMAKGEAPLKSEARSRLAKFWYGSDASIHYELALHESASQLEIGLHAESTPDRNRAFYTAFDRCMMEIQRELGPQMWLEEWDRGWARLYETEPLWPLDTVRALSVAERLVEVISVIQPIYEAVCGVGVE